MPGKRIPTEALAEIASAALVGTELERELAARLGLGYDAVNWNMRRFRRHGWVNVLGTAPCRRCGETVLGPPRAVLHRRCRMDEENDRRREQRRSGRSTPSTPYVKRWRERHPDRLAEYCEADKRRVRVNYHALPGTKQATLLERVHAADRRDYPLTVQAARRIGDDWTDDEDRYILDHPKTPAREVGLQLGRTLWAVRARRMRLRRRSETGDRENRVTTFAQGAEGRR